MSIIHGCNRHVQDGAETLPGGAVGLVVSDTVSGRMGIFTMLCGEKQQLEANAALIQAPSLVLRSQDRAREWSQIRRINPVVGELLHFARSAQGGLPVRRDELLNNGSLPSVSVIKKVSPADWAPVMGSAEAMWHDARKALGALIKQSAQSLSHVLNQPGEMDSPELVAFRIQVLKEVRTWREQRRLETHGVQRPKV